MKTLAYSAILAVSFGTVAHSDGLWKKAKGAVANTAEGVGSAVAGSVEGTADFIGNEGTAEEKRERIDEMANEAMNQLLSDDRNAKTLYEGGSGYAVFDARQLTALGATAGYGRGVAISKATGKRTYMNMGTGGVGLSFGIGGFDHKVVVLFEDNKSFTDFVKTGFDATAGAGAMAGEVTDGGNVRFVDGRSFFVLTEGGWKVSATATGTKYWANQDLN